MVKGSRLRRQRRRPGRGSTEQIYRYKPSSCSECPALLPWKVGQREDMISCLKEELVKARRKEVDSEAMVRQQYFS